MNPFGKFTDKAVNYYRRRRSVEPDLRIKWRVAVFCLAILMPILTWVFGLAPDFVERFYTEDISRVIALSLARITAPFPFSLIEIIAYLLLARFAVLAIVGLADFARRRRRLWSVVANGMIRFGTMGCVVVVLFYVNWGFNFARPDLLHRMAWESYVYDQEPQQQEDELARLSEELLEAANREFLNAFGADRLGRPSKAPMSRAELDAAVERGYTRAAKELGLPKYFGIPRAPAKPVIASEILNQMLILGMYSPFTGEANYNRFIPDCTLPQVLGHEKAHQRLVTNESEANFFGYLACAYSDDPYVRYSGFLFAHRQLLFELLKLNPERSKQLIKKRLHGVQIDVYDANMWSVRSVGITEPIGRAVNDAYLKANRVTNGVMAYQESSRYLIAFARARGGRIVGSW